jgi:hypothetical protein
MTKSMPVKSVSEHRKKTVHRDRLDRVSVRCQSVKQIADLTAVMKRERETLDSAVKIAAKIVDHLLPNFDRRIIVENAQSSQEKIDNDQACASKPENVLRRPGIRKLPGHGCSGQDVIDDDF